MTEDEIRALQDKLVAAWDEASGRSEIESLRARLSEAEALLRELRMDLVSSQSSQLVVAQIGEKLHDRLMAEERLRLISRRLARIDAFLAADSASVKATGWARTGGNAPAGVELMDDGTLYVPPDTPPGTYTVEYTEGTYADQPPDVAAYLAPCPKCGQRMSSGVHRAGSCGSDKSGAVAK